MGLSFEVDLLSLIDAARTEQIVSFHQARGRIDDVLSTRIGEYRWIEDGVVASIFDQDVIRPFDLHTLRRNHISFSFVRDGGYVIQLGALSYPTKPAMARMTIAASSKTHHTPGASARKVAGVIAFVDRACLIDRYGLDVDKLPEDVRHTLRAPEGPELSIEIPLSPWSWIAVDQILASRFVGRLRAAYFQAKVAELLCEAVGYLNMLDRPASLRIPAARREQSRIETAALIYRRDMRQPPSLHELAAKLGINRNKLNDGFRDLYGVTPHEYSRRVRLDWARERIVAGAMTISEICDAVGYSSHSAFTRAYGEVFGYAPSDTPGATGARRTRR